MEPKKEEMKAIIEEEEPRKLGSASCRRRRKELFNETNELCELCGAEAAAIVFSRSGNVYVYAHPHIDTIIDRYNSVVDKPKPSSSSDSEERSTACSLSESEKIIMQTKRDGKGWKEAIADLDSDQLDDLAATIEKIKKDFAAARAKVDGA